MGRKIFSFKYVATVLLTIAVLILGASTSSRSAGMFRPTTARPGFRDRLESRRAWLFRKVRPTKRVSSAATF